MPRVREFVAADGELVGLNDGCWAAFLYIQYQHMPNAVAASWTLLYVGIDVGLRKFVSFPRVWHQGIADGEFSNAIFQFGARWVHRLDGQGVDISVGEATCSLIIDIYGILCCLCELNAMPLYGQVYLIYGSILFGMYNGLLARRAYL